MFTVYVSVSDGATAMRGTGSFNSYPWGAFFACSDMAAPQFVLSVGTTTWIAYVRSRKVTDKRGHSMIASSVKRPLRMPIRSFIADFSAWQSGFEGVASCRTRILLWWYYVEHLWNGLRLPKYRQSEWHSYLTFQPLNVFGHSLWKQVYLLTKKCT